MVHIHTSSESTLVVSETCTVLHPCSLSPASARPSFSARLGLRRFLHRFAAWRGTRPTATTIGIEGHQRSGQATANTLAFSNTQSSSTQVAAPVQRKPIIPVAGYRRRSGLVLRASTRVLEPAFLAVHSSILFHSHFFTSLHSSLSLLFRSSSPTASSNCVVSHCTS